MTEGDKTKEGIEGKEKTMYIQANLPFGPVPEQVRWQRLMGSNLKFRKQKNDLNKGGENSHCTCKSERITV